jgi:AcrR family transcriptional regulator
MTNQRRFRGRHDSGARERLIHATRTCLRDRGVADTSSRLIAQTAGENLGAITYYFGSKDELVATALAHELSAWIQPVLDAIAKPGDPATRLVDAIGALNDAFETQRARVPALLDVFVQAARDRDARAPISAIWNGVHTQLAGVISELHASHVIARWVDPDGMASLIVAVVAGTVVHEAITTGGTQHRQIAAQFAGLLLGARADDAS